MLNLIHLAFAPVILLVTSRSRTLSLSVFDNNMKTTEKNKIKINKIKKKKSNKMMIPSKNRLNDHLE